jgi:Flp pilus assembly protein TadG
MIASALPPHLSALLRRFRRDGGGVSAVEFALVLPLLLSLYIGSMEVSQGIAADRKVTLMARTVADLASQVSTITNADMNNLLNASAAVMQPYSASALKITVSSVVVDAQGRATIAWSDTRNGTARTPGAAVSLPAALLVPNTSLVWGEAEYTYTPAVGYVVTGPLALKDQIYMRPRLSATVARTA